MKRKLNRPRYRTVRKLIQGLGRIVRRRGDNTGVHFLARPNGTIEPTDLARWPE